MLRIVGGSLGGRRIPGPAPGSGARPTTERLREAIASALESRGVVAGARVLDLFTGTGALAFELLSRGARDASLVDRDARALVRLRRTIDELELADRARPVQLDLLARPERVAAELARLAPGPHDLVTCDPPYARVADAIALLAALAGHADLLGPAVLIVLEHASRDALELPAPLASARVYTHGDSAASLLCVVR